VPRAVAIVDQEQFWVAGRRPFPAAPTFLHFDHGRWTEVPGPVLPGGRTGGYVVTALTFPAPDIGWAAATDYEGPGISRGLVLHYKDGVWRNRNWDWHFWNEPWWGLFGM
jgi:hypothetical protein